MLYFHEDNLRVSAIQWQLLMRQKRLFHSREYSGLQFQCVYGQWYAENSLAALSTLRFALKLTTRLPSCLHDMSRDSSRQQGFVRFCSRQKKQIFATKDGKKQTEESRWTKRESVGSCIVCIWSSYFACTDNKKGIKCREITAKRATCTRPNKFQRRLKD